VWPTIGYDDRKVFELLAGLGLRAVDQDGQPLPGLKDRLHVRLMRGTAP
jgi:hypothetical protein